MLSVDFAVAPRSELQLVLWPMDSSQQIQGRLQKSLKAIRVATLLYVNFLFFYFWFSSRFTLGFYCAYLYMLISRVRKELSHSDWLFVVNLRLTHESCLGITIVNLCCFGSPRQLTNYSWSEQRSGNITEIANYSYSRLNYS